MNLLPVLGWPGFLVLGLIPPLILMLYFLKLRRTPLEVPSTYLWARTMEDLHVNSIWQRLRKSILLLLQILLALMLLLACLRPGCQGEKLIGERFIFLIDQSSSMSATDAPDGKSRLEFAKEEIRNLIDRMESDDSGMIIGFSNTANVVQSYTRSKSLLKRQLEQVTQTNRSTDIVEALAAASGLANPGQTSDRESDRDIQVADALTAKLFIFSDGGIRKVPNISLGKGLETEYHPVGDIDSPKNVGIGAFSLSSELESANGLQAFVQIQNSDDEDHSVTVELFVDGDVFDVRTDVAIAKETSRALSFEFGDLLSRIDKPVPIEIRIKEEDVYMADNIAYGVLEPPRRAKVLIVTPSNQFLELATGTERMKKLASIEFQPPRFLKEKSFEEMSTLGAYDLVIFDQCAPEKMPQCNTMFFGSAPPVGWTVGEKQFPVNVIDSDISHPLMDSVSFGTVIIIESRMVTGPKGTLSLLDATFGPIMAIGPREGFQDLVVGFSLLEFDDEGEASINTTWVKKVSFPIFLQNVIAQMAGGFRFNESQGFSPGELVKFRTTIPTQSAEVTSPGGKRSELSPRPDKRFVYTGTETKGVYSVKDLETDSLDQMFAVNLFDSRESDLTVRDTLEIGYEEITGKAESIPARKDYWTWIILVALIILMVEWYIYNRRVFI